MDWTLGGATDLLHRLYPNAYVTSGYRDPNSKLGKANPRSYHNHGQAFDIRPMQGVEFNDYVGKLKAAGLPVAEALDEQKKPMPWTTGPNWHIAFGGQKKDMPNPMMDPTQRAKMFNVNIPPEQQPGQPFDLHQALAGVGQQILAPQLHASESQPHEKNGPLGMSKDRWGTMLAALADFFNSRAGHQTNMFGSLLDSRQKDDDRAAEQQHWSEQMQMQRDEMQAKANEPPQFIQNLQAFQGMPQPQQAAYLQYLDMTQPIAVSGPQGTQRVPRTMGPQPGAVEDGYVFLGGDPSNPNSWRPQ